MGISGEKMKNTFTAGDNGNYNIVNGIKIATYLLLGSRNNT